MSTPFQVPLTLDTKFLFSTSGSASSIIKHNTALRELGLDVNYFTLKDKVTPESYCGLLRSPVSLGGAVTAHGGLKSSIIPYLDTVDDLAVKTKAVNTVVNREGRLTGYNTDAFGLKEALEKGLGGTALSIKTAVIYGNGGVAGVAWHVLQEMGIEVAMRGRDPQRVLQKKKSLGIEKEKEPVAPFDLVVDATPISSSPDFMKAEGFEELVTEAHMVFCHNMPEKDGYENYLEQYCKEHSKGFIPGSEMYRGQLIKQYSLFLEPFLIEGQSITEAAIMKAWKL